MSKIHLYISTATMIAFFLPLITQFRGKFFYYFLLLALAGITGTFLSNFGVSPNISYYLFTHLIIILFQFTDFKKSFRKWHILLHLIPPFLAHFWLPYPYTEVYFILLHLIVSSYIFLRAFADINKKLEIPLFYFILSLYEITIIMRSLLLIINADNVIYYYSIINLFQIFLAVIFIFVRDDNPKLALKLTNNPSILRNREDPDYLIHDRFTEE